eukprot:TRINITY_DN5224_c0_g1_i3.p1 TRINITY_DN5224_c0_g1~~TRINITY_DN5224_c0_g1_i3.p1  ORF type:complete len:908 (+),score=205.50 TRINITY_DN5224_c0_g1_i3:682-3405(+)
MTEHAKQSTPVPLTMILKATGISLVDLFEPLKDFVNILRIGDEARKAVADLQRKHVNCSLLYKKYVSVFENMVSVPLDRVLQGRLFKAGWTLYLVAKETVMKNGTDLLSEFNVLLACCTLLYVHIRPSLRRPLQSRITAEHVREGGLDVMSVVSDLCDMHIARPSEVLEVYSEHLIPMMENLCQEGTLKCERAQDAEGNWDFHTLFNTQHLEENVAAFDVQYSCIDDERVRDHDKAPTHLDERQLLVPLNCIGSPSRLGQRIRSYYNYPTQSTTPLRRAAAAADGMAGSATPTSPRPLSRPPTPHNPSEASGPPPSQPVGFINETFQSVSWLRSTIGHECEPSKRLLEFVKVADRNSGPRRRLLPPAEEEGEGRTSAASAKDAREEGVKEEGRGVGLEQEIMERCKMLCSKVNFGPQGEERRNQAVSVYMKMLESLMVAEEKRLQTNDFSTLLRHDIFHRSLIACAVEIVQFCYKLDMNSMTALDLFDVKPFEMIKIIEAIVRHTEDLPESVIRHFNEMEQVILQERAWKSGSTLYELLSHEEQKHLGTTVLSTAPTPRSTAATPMSPLQRSSRPRPSNVRSSSLELFYRKIMVLAARRTKELCQQLKIPTTILKQVWSAYSNILLWKPNMLKNRHLDQIMMCTLYGICRANRHVMTFQNIIDCYRRQPQATGSTWRDVMISEEVRGDIIQFYNRVFIRELESYLLKFKADGTSQSETADDDVSIPVSPLKIPASPIQVDPRHNLYMSPLTQRHQLYSTSPLMTHSIGYSPARNLSSINSKLTKRRALFRDSDGPNKRQRTSEDSSAASTSAASASATSSSSAGLDDRDVQEGSADLATLASLSGLDIAQSPEKPRRKKEEARKSVKSPRKKQAPARAAQPPARSGREPPNARKSPRQPKPRSLDTE